MVELWRVKVIVGILINSLGQGNTSLVKWRHRLAPPMGIVCMMLFITQSVANNNYVMNAWLLMYISTWPWCSRLRRRDIFCRDRDEINTFNSLHETTHWHVLRPYRDWDIDTKLQPCLRVHKNIWRLGFPILCGRVYGEYSYSVIDILMPTTRNDMAHWLGDSLIPTVDVDMSKHFSGECTLFWCQVSFCVTAFSC